MSAIVMWFQFNPTNTNGNFEQTYWTKDGQAGNGKCTCNSGDTFSVGITPSDGTTLTSVTNAFVIVSSKDKSNKASPFGSGTQQAVLFPVPNPILGPSFVQHTWPIATVVASSNGKYEITLGVMVTTTASNTQLAYAQDPEMDVSGTGEEIPQAAGTY